MEAIVAHQYHTTVRWVRWVFLLEWWGGAQFRAMVRFCLRSQEKWSRVSHAAIVWKCISSETTSGCSARFARNGFLLSAFIFNKKFHYFLHSFLQINRSISMIIYIFRCISISFFTFLKTTFSQCQNCPTEILLSIDIPMLDDITQNVLKIISD